MTVFLCSACGAAITPELVELPAIPDAPGFPPPDAETRRAESTVPRGHFAIEPEPWGAPYVLSPDQDDSQAAQPRGAVMSTSEGLVISAGSRNSVVLHPDDALGLQLLPDCANSSGCCGPSGDEGLNRACSCGAPIATLAAACFTPYELHLEPDRVRRA